MKKKKLLAIIAGVLILAVGIGVGAYAASAFGTQSDPLVAKSYLDNTLTPKLQAEFQAKLDEQVRQMEEKIMSATSAAGGNFTTLTLAAGKTLYCQTGCEIILRSGSAAAVSASGLSDVSAGSAIAGGSGLSQNHLYLVCADNEGVKATGSAATLMVRGSYKTA